MTSRRSWLLVVVPWVLVGGLALVLFLVARSIN